MSGTSSKALKDSKANEVKDSKANEVDHSQYKSFLNWVGYGVRANKPKYMELEEKVKSMTSMAEKKALVDAWLKSGKNINVTIEESSKTEKGNKAGGLQGYAMPGQIATLMGIKVEYFDSTQEFKVATTLKEKPNPLWGLGWAGAQEVGKPDSRAPLQFFLVG